jgi:hypothetical protein
VEPEEKVGRHVAREVEQRANGSPARVPLLSYSCFPNQLDFFSKCFSNRECPSSMLRRATSSLI